MKQRSLRPGFLTAADVPWIARLLDAYASFEGRTMEDLANDLLAEVSDHYPARKSALVIRVLHKKWPSSSASGANPVTIRHRCFRAAALELRKSEPCWVRSALKSTADEMSISDKDIKECFFADLPSQCKLGPRPTALTPQEVILEANELVVSDLVKSCYLLRLWLDDPSRRVIRQAKLHGLICSVRDAPEAGSSAQLIEISGPFALFRRTAIYARALCAQVPLITSSGEFRLEIVQDPKGEKPSFLVLSGDPLRSSPPKCGTKRFDSRVEERFFRDFCRAGRDWEISRELRPIATAAGLFFPDFELRHRVTDERKFVEIVGFWTADYIEHKRKQLASVVGESIVVCIDRQIDLAAFGAGLSHSLVPFSKYIDVAAVLHRL